MGEGEIKENPSIKKLREDAGNFRNLKKIWPFLKPFASLLGADTGRIDETLEQAVELAEQVDEMTVIPDRFNDLFSDRGWILFDSMELEVAKEAILIAEQINIDAADEFLADHFSPDWVESRISRLKYTDGFQPRFELAKQALEDYKAGRYYASVLVTLTLLDGWVNELNIIDFQRHGFFSEEAQLVAWDSIAAHPKGLVKLQKVFGKARKATREEKITIPYRHGIIHGMDLGYNNKVVAAKCWAALFAVRDWVGKLTKGELTPPEAEPEEGKTLLETIESYQRTQQKIAASKQWKPREVRIGETIPGSGEPQDFPDKTPEQKLVEFMNYWLKNNYGFMAQCTTPMLSVKPVDIREFFHNYSILDYALLNISEVDAYIADIAVAVSLKENESVNPAKFSFRLIRTNREGELDYYGEEEIWGIANWSKVKE